MKKNSLLIYSAIVILISAMLFNSCGGEKKNEAATYGHLVFGCEKSLQYIMESEANMFTYFYKQATIQPEFDNETKLVEDFINRKRGLVVVYRDFTENEKQLLADRKIVPYSTIIGLEGLALIVHPGNKDTAITIEQLKTLLSGQGDSLYQLQTKWRDVVFDGQGSSNFRFVDSLINKKKLSEYCFTKNSPQECIDYVAQNKNALGIVSFAMLADKDDKRVKEARKKIKIMSVSEDGKNYFRPAQASFFNFDYPLIRKIYMHTNEGNGSLAMGFISYVSSEEGQLIIKQGGLMPARMQWNDMNVVYEQMNIK